MRSTDSKVRRWALSLPTWIGSTATVALILVLVGLVSAGAWVGVQTSAASAKAQQAASVDDKYQEALTLVAKEETLLLKYRLVPDPTFRADHEQVAIALVADLKAVDAMGEEDRVVARRLTIVHASYLDASRRMFDAVAVGNLVGADDISRVEVAPLYSQIQNSIEQEASQHQDESALAFHEQRELLSAISRVTPVVLGLAILLIGFLTLVLQVNRRAREAKSSFLARVSHELRTPLNSILGFSQLFLLTEGATLNDKQRRYLNNIHSSGSHLLDLINDVLDMSKAEAGKMGVELAPVALDDAIAAAVEEVAPLLGARHLELRPLTGTRGLTISADRMRFRQVLLNGLSNAIKFTEGGGSITIATRSAKAAVFIDITDTGKGIPADQLARMFEEFEQLDNGRSRRGEGTGIGLPLSKALVEMMGGRLTLSSREGIGTTFHVRLPAARQVFEATPTDLSTNPPSGLTRQMGDTRAAAR